MLLSLTLILQFHLISEFLELYSSQTLTVKSSTINTVLSSSEFPFVYFPEFDKLYIDGSNVKDVNHTDREYYLRKYIKKVLSIKDKLLKDAATHCPRLIVKG